MCTQADPSTAHHSKDRLLRLMACSLVFIAIGGCSSESALVSVEPSALDFGEVQIGEVGSELLELSNSGEESATVVFELSPESSFRVDLEYPIELPPSASRFVFVEARPSALGLNTELLRLLWGNSLSEVALQVTGVGAAGDVDQDGFTVEEGDCDDEDPTVHPDAMETCDAIDNNCDEETDEGFDVDEDGITSCGLDGDISTLDDNDCDDSDPDNFPGNTEICEPGGDTDQVDNNCDASDDTSAQSTWLRDADGDGVGAATDPTADEVLACGAPGSDFALAVEDPAAPGTWIEDCDDDDPDNFPGNSETCDGQDNDCSGTADFVSSEDDGGGEGDTDSDTSLDCEDCEDDNADNYPTGVEVCDSQDNNCDGETDENANDSDTDGFGCTDCNDSDNTVYPGATEVCDGQDTDCNGFDDFGNPGVAGGETDDDGDQQAECEGDCDDDPATGSTNFTGNTEACDGLDNDCDAGTEAAGGESDGDADSSLSCADCDDSDADNFPGNVEVCDGQDNDCNAGADFTTTSDDGGGESADSDSDTVLDCDDCDDGDGDNYPGNAEACDGQDNDCNGLADFIATTDDGGTETVDTDSDSVLDCADCDDGDGDNYPGNAEECDGQDNDCNGLADFIATADDGGTETVDTDSDSVLDCADCADSDHNNFPGNSEACDGQDNDCSGVADFIATADDGGGEIGDIDSDGAIDCADCDDTDNNNYPGNSEACDGQDNDCNGVADFTTTANDGGGESNSDSDGFLDCADCSDTESAAYPGAPEICDSIDNNCDSAIDDADATGLGAACAGSSCLDILNTRVSSSQDGTYWIDPAGTSPYQGYCDMTTEGGGWTLVSNKTTPTSTFSSGSVDLSCSNSTSTDCPSAISSDLSWATAMWRFADTSSYLVFFDEVDNDESAVQYGFAGWLNGEPGNHYHNVVLYKQVNGISTPKTTLQLYWYTDRGFSEDHSGSDTWIDVFDVPDTSDSYISVESPSLQGQMCLAGYCRSNSIWLMVR